MVERVILITGASGGMGTEMSHYFSVNGYKLALHSHSNEISVSEAANIKHFKGDLTQEAACQKLIEEVIAHFGRIDVLINNAGVSHSSMSWKTSADSWRSTMALNLDAPFYLAKFSIPFMREAKSGSIINISSIVAQTGFIGTASYAASKAGLIGLTKTLSKEVAASGINVNALALGYFNTGMINDVPEEMKETITENIPMKKLGDPATVCKTIEYLISKEAKYVTGQTINLNGGMYS